MFQMLIRHIPTLCPEVVADITFLTSPLMIFPKKVHCDDLLHMCCKIRLGYRPARPILLAFVDLLPVAYDPLVIDSE